jgi:hypothetical protein
MNLQLVEVFEAFYVHDYLVRPGARVYAWQKPDASWVVYFNGNDVPIPATAAGPIGSAAGKKELPQVHSAARLEQYQVAPAKPS